MDKESWKATVGALCLVVLATVISLIVTEWGDEAGVYRRWWDGTLEKTEDTYRGKLSRRTFYGEDGKTEVRSEEYFTYGPLTGKLARLRELLEDGRMHKTEYDQNGKLAQEIMQSVSGGVILHRKYTNGVLVYELTRSDDRAFNVISRKTYFPDGSPEEISELDKNGTMITTGYYHGGKLKLKRQQQVNGEGSANYFYDDGKTLKEQWQVSAKVWTIRHVGRDQKLLWDIKAEVHGAVDVTFYGNQANPIADPKDSAKPRPLYVQHYQWYSNGIQMTAVTEYNSSGKKVRWINTVGPRFVYETKDFDEQGRVRKHCKFHWNAMKSEETFDENGKSTGKREFKNGPNQTVDRSHLEFPETPFFSPERD